MFDTGLRWEWYGFPWTVSWNATARFRLARSERGWVFKARTHARTFVATRRAHGLLG